jgi:hypothetical protein
MRFRRSRSVRLIRVAGVAVALLLVAAESSAQPSEAKPGAGTGPDTAAAPAYTLEVDSDAPEVLSYGILAPRLAQDLGGVVAAPSSGPPRQAAIAIRYRDRTLTVRAVHSGEGDRVLERSIRPEGEAAAIRAEAVLLAGNLARDEARELLDELAARGLRSPAPPPPAPAADAAPPVKDSISESHRPATVSIVYPLATNAGDPDVVSPINFGLLYSRVGRSEALDFVPLGVAHASRGVSGAQLGTAAAISGGSASGLQFSAGASFAVEHVTGAQLATGFNYAGKGLGGTQVTAGLNLVAKPGRSTSSEEHFRGSQISSLANITTTPGHGFQGTAGINLASESFEGAQLGVVNMGGDFSGTQLGIVNIGRKVKGLQLGVLNIADEVDGVALGLASISKDSVHPIFWGGNLAYTNTGIKFTTKYVYTVVALGVGTLEKGFDSGPLLTTGLGGHIPLPASFDLDLEAAYSDITSNANENRSLHVRAIPGYRLWKYVRVFAGAGPRIPLAYETGSLAVRPEVFGGVQF